MQSKAKQSRGSPIPSGVISVPSPLVIVDMMRMHEETWYQKLWQNPCKLLGLGKAGHSCICIHEKANEQINE